jgi:hypothetical protein
MKTIQLPDQVYEQAAELAALDRLPVDRFLAGLIQDQASAWSRLQAHASRDSGDGLAKLHQVLDKVPALPPEPADQL